MGVFQKPKWVMARISFLFNLGLGKMLKLASLKALPLVLLKF
jgi:hypothetical protein